jgi:hypothetical protein
MYAISPFQEVGHVKMVGYCPDVQERGGEA